MKIFEEKKEMETISNVSTFLQNIPSALKCYSDKYPTGKSALWRAKFQV